MYKPQIHDPSSVSLGAVGGDPIFHAITTDDNVAESSLMAPSSTTTARKGKELASDEGEITIGFSSPVARSRAPPNSDPFQLEAPPRPVRPQMGTPDSIRWGDARLGVVVHPPTSSSLGTPSASRQRMRDGSNNPFRAGPSNKGPNKTPDNDERDWETVFGDGNTGDSITGTTHQKPDYRMRRQYDNGESDNEGDDLPRQWGARGGPPPARPLSPLFPGVPHDTRFPLFGTETMKSPPLPNRRLVFGEEEGRPVFPPEQRVHRVNGRLLGEEDSSANTTVTTTGTATTRTGTTATQSARSRQYLGDDEFSTTEFEDIPLGVVGAAITTSSRHPRVELCPRELVPAPLRLKPSRPLPLHLEQVENQAPAKQEESLGGWLGRAYNRLSRPFVGVPRDANLFAGERDVFTADGRTRAGHRARVGEAVRRARDDEDGRAWAGDAASAWAGEDGRAPAGDRARPGAGGRSRLATREEFSETRDGFSVGRDGFAGGRIGVSGARGDFTGTRGNVAGTRGNVAGGRDGVSGGPGNVTGTRGNIAGGRDGVSGGPGNVTGTRGERPGARVRAGTIFDKISGRQPMPLQDQLACQTAFNMSDLEFSETRRKAQQLREQALANAGRAPAHHRAVFAQDGEESSFEGQHAPHDNWIQHEGQSSLGMSGPSTTRGQLSDLDSYFGDTTPSQILPTLPFARPPSPVSPNASLHRAIALFTLERPATEPTTSTPAPAPTVRPSPYNLNPATTGSSPYNLNLSFRLPAPPPVPAPSRSLWDNPRPTRTPATSLPPAALLHAPTRPRIGIARTTRGPYQEPASPSRPSPPLPFPELQPRCGGASRLPSTRRVRSQRNITPLLLAQRASRAVERSLRGRGHGQEQQGIELREFGRQEFWEIGEDVEAQRRRTGREVMDHWWAKAVLV